MFNCYRRCHSLRSLVSEVGRLDGHRWIRYEVRHRMNLGDSEEEVILWLFEVLEGARLRHEAEDLPEDVIIKSVLSQ